VSRTDRALWLEHLGLIAGLAVLASCTLPFIGWWIGETDFQHLSAHPAVARETLLQFGQTPLWNPYCVGGLSLVADQNAAFLCPTFLLLLLFDVYAGMIVEYVLLGTLGGYGLYLIARQTGTSRAAAVLPAVLFVTSNALAVYLVNGWYTRLALGLVPIGLWSFLSALKAPPERARRFTVLVAVILAVMFLHGCVYFAVYMIGVFAVVLTLHCARHLTLAPVWRWGVPALLFGLLIAAKLAPLIDEGTAGHECELGYAFTPIAMLDALTSWSANWESCGTLGWAALVLAGLGLLVSVRRLWPLAVAAALIFVYALGPNLTPETWDTSRVVEYHSGNPPSLATYVQQLPALGCLRNPARSLIVLSMLISVASAHGLDALARAVGLLGRIVPGAAVAVPWLRRAVALVVCLLATAAPFGHARNYLAAHMHLRVAGTPEPAGDVFSQRPDCGGPMAYCPKINAGSAEEWLPFHKRPFGLAITTDPHYSGEQFWVGDGDVSVTRWTPNRLVYELHGSGPGQLIVNQGFADGWTASGAATAPPESSDGLLAVRAVAPGTVILAYRPPVFPLGCALSGLGLGLTFAWLFAGPIRRRKREALATTEPDRP
jgi:hypothetical protein